MRIHRTKTKSKAPESLAPVPYYSDRPLDRGGPCGLWRLTSETQNACSTMAPMNANAAQTARTLSFMVRSIRRTSIEVAAAEASGSGGRVKDNNVLQRGINFSWRWIELPRRYGTNRRDHRLRDSRLNGCARNKTVYALFVDEDDDLRRQDRKDDCGFAFHRCHLAWLINCLRANCRQPNWPQH